LDINPNRPEAYVGMALIYQSTREKDKALEMAKKALKMAPRFPGGHYAMSRIIYDEGKYDKALESVNTAIRLHSGSPYFYFHRADIYMKLRNNEAAVKDYEQACKMNASWGCQRAEVVKQQMGEVKK
jgi:Tfp pilus assembly protein PilF